MFILFSWFEFTLSVPCLSEFSAISSELILALGWSILFTKDCEYSLWVAGNCSASLLSFPIIVGINFLATSVLCGSTFSSKLRFLTGAWKVSYIWFSALMSEKVSANISLFVLYAGVE